MLLEHFNKDNRKKLNKINKLLKEQYGISISKKASLDELYEIKMAVVENITSLKMNGKVSITCSSLSKNIMVLEGINVLLDSYGSSGSNSDLGAKSYNSVVKWLCDYVINCVNLGDDFYDAVKSAMREYRSSQWRFPDEAVQSDLEHGVLSHFKSGLTEQGLMPMPDDSGIITIQTSDDGGDVEPETNMLGNILSPDEMQNVVIWLVTPDCGMGDDVRNKMSDYYTSQGTCPEEPDDTWFFNNMMDDFGEELSCNMEQCDWDCVVRRRNPDGDTANPDMGVGMSMDCGEIELDPDMLNTIIRNNKSQLKDSKGEKRMNGIRENIIKRLRLLLESEVSEAEIIIAAKGFSKSLQEMVEKIGRLQNEDLPPLTDQMRDIYGVPQASVFQVEIQQSLQGVMDALYDAKDHVDLAVQKMAMGQDLSVDIDMEKPLGDEMGADVDLDQGAVEPGVEDFGLPDDLDLGGIPGPGDEFGDEFGAAESDEPLGRLKKESVESLKKRLSEMQVLVDRAKTLKESHDKPSAGLSAKKKSEVVKKATAGKDIGKKGKGFDDVAAAAKKSGAKDPNAVAAAAMWKNVKR